MRISPGLLPHCSLSFSRRNKLGFLCFVSALLSAFYLIAACTPSATDVSWKHSSLASGCKLLRCALIPPSNSCCTCWLTAVPEELLPGCDIPAGVATGGGAAAIPPSVHQQTHPEENFYSPWDELPAPRKTYSKMQPFVQGKKVMKAVFFPSALYMQ